MENPKQLGGLSHSQQGCVCMDRVLQQVGQQSIDAGSGDIVFQPTNCRHHGGCATAGRTTVVGGVGDWSIWATSFLRCRDIRHSGGDSREQLRSLQQNFGISQAPQVRRVHRHRRRTAQHPYGPARPDRSRKERRVAGPESVTQSGWSTRFDAGRRKISYRDTRPGARFHSGIQNQHIRSFSASVAGIR